MSHSIILTFKDPTDKYTPGAHVATDPTTNAILMMPKTTKAKHMLAHHFLKYVEREKDPNGLPVVLTVVDATDRQHMTLVFPGRCIEDYRNALKLLLEEGFVPNTGRESEPVEACVHCGDEPKQRFTGKPHAIVCDKKKCVSTIASLVK